MKKFISILILMFAFTQTYAIVWEDIAVTIGRDVVESIIINAIEKQVFNDKDNKTTESDKENEDKKADGNAYLNSVKKYNNKKPNQLNVEPEVNEPDTLETDVPNGLVPRQEVNPDNIDWSELDYAD